MTKKKDRWHLDELAAILGVSEVIDRANDWDFSEDYSHGRREALKNGATEDEAETMGQEMEQRAIDEQWGRLMGGFDAVLERVKDITGIEFVRSKKGAYRMVCSDWHSACSKIVTIINGVGYFRFEGAMELRYSGPYSTYRQAALAHLHWIKDYPNVYGDRKFSDIIYASMR